MEKKKLERYSNVFEKKKIKIAYAFDFSLDLLETKLTCWTKKNRARFTFIYCFASKKCELVRQEWVWWIKIIGKPENVDLSRKKYENTCSNETILVGTVYTSNPIAVLSIWNAFTFSLHPKNERQLKSSQFCKLSLFFSISFSIVVNGIHLTRMN